MPHHEAAQSNDNGITSRELAVAKTVRAACAQIAREAYYDASIQGLCSEGAAEVAQGAIEALDLAPLIAQAAVPDQDRR